VVIGIRYASARLQRFFDVHESARARVLVSFCFFGMEFKTTPA